MSNDEGWNRCAQSVSRNNNDRIPYFDPPAADPPEEDSLFLVRYSLFNFRPCFIKAAAFYPRQPPPQQLISTSKVAAGFIPAKRPVATAKLSATDPTFLLESNIIGINIWFLY
jgi:hypothetical protein